jgi:mono/diheme cytochrome c family protein
LFAGTVPFAAGDTLTNASSNIAPTNTTPTSSPVFVPDVSHANGPLPDGILAWNKLSQDMDAPADQASAHFVFNVTNISPDNIVILGAHGSCSCTVTELPPLPWTIPPAGNGQIGATVNIEGKTGVLFKSITVSTDKGSKDVYVRITMLPPVVHILTDSERSNDLAIAKLDRQAIFKADCATCHVKPGEGKYGKTLYDAICGVCHDAKNRAEVVPDLNHLKTPTNDEFWRTWTAHGKPGSLMPAFATAEGGPLNDMQIATLVAYLKLVNPSPEMTNSVPAN